MKISEAIANAAAVLQDASISEPRREASSLLAFVIQQDAAFLVAHSEDPLAAPYKMMFDACVRRRAKHEPFQYITGRQEFYGLQFAIIPGVLIPRPETEILVENAIKLLADVPTPHFCEIGTGSGCISVSILHEVETATAVAVDISAEALAVARQNAESNNVAERLTLHSSDVFENVSGPFDMIVSNPPYIPASHIAGLQQEVRDHEPHLALSGGDDGLDIIRRIVAEAPEHLSPSGHILLEVGFDQAEPVSGLFDPNLWNPPSTVNDLQQIPRIIIAKLR